MSLDFALGFIAGEGTFTISANRSGGLLYPKMRFSVRIHNNDKDGLLATYESFDNLGRIQDVNGRDTVSWAVEAKDELEQLRDMIEEHAPSAWWRTEKADNFRVWSNILDIHIDGRTTPEQSVEMFKMAKDGLNVGRGIDEEQWEEYIEQVSERI